MYDLLDILDGDAPFPRIGTRVYDGDDIGLEEFGTVIEAEYPKFTVEWDGSLLISVEKVRY